jgi:hypothetical protein
MRFGRWLILFIGLSAFAANVKMYLKDGGFHLVREYKVLSDRVRYFSVERGDWEEIPLELVDLKRTETESKQRKAALDEETKIIEAEEKVEREQRKEIEKIPQNPGVYQTVGGELRTIKQAESKVHNNKGRNILKGIAPIPIVSGKATLELDGSHSLNKVNVDRPEFYIQLSAEERFGIIRLTPKGGVRIAERLTIVPITKEIVEEQDTVEVFRKQLDDGLYKIWPTKPLEPGEYAVVEYTEGKLNIQIWDFAYDPKAPDWKPTAVAPAAPKK